MSSKPHSLDPAAAQSSAGSRGASGLPVEYEVVLDRFERYLALERSRSEHTRRAYLSDVTSLLEFATNEHRIKALAEIDLAVLRLWLGEQQARGKAPATLARHAASVRTFMAWALREEIIPADPSLRLRSPKNAKRLPHVLQDSQMHRLLDDEPQAEPGAAQLPAPTPRQRAVADRDRAILELLYATGIRVGELTGLDVDDIDHDRRTLRVLGKG
ncbi:MAG: site-specific integrase, partial [Micrococcaceae bacterium]|nr:site-specific integrase [Micrococcaceae bacterium]